MKTMADKFQWKNFAINVGIILISGLCALFIENTAAVQSHLSLYIEPEIVWPLMAISLNVVKYIMRALPLIK